MSSGSNPYVKMFHSIPHIIILKFYGDISENGADGDFHLSMISPNKNTSYLHSIFTLPLIIAMIGVLSIVLFQFCLWVRCVCHRIGCCEIMSSQNAKGALHSERITNVCAIFLLIALSFDHLILYGRVRFEDGIHFFFSGVENLIILFSTINISTKYLYGNSTELSKFNAARNCEASNIIQSSSGTLISSSFEMNDLTDTILKNLISAKNYLDNYLGSTYSLCVFFGIYGVTALVILLNLISVATRSKMLVQAMVACSEFLIIILTAVICILTTLLVRPLYSSCISDNSNSSLYSFPLCSLTDIHGRFLY